MSEQTDSTSGVKKGGWSLFKKKDQPQVPTRPRWYLNTYFWWAACLFVLAIAGMVRGVGIITDPGQQPEKNLVLVYFTAAVCMTIGGWIGHDHQVRIYRRLTGDPKDEEK